MRVQFAFAGASSLISTFPSLPPKNQVGGGTSFPCRASHPHLPSSTGRKMWPYPATSTPFPNHPLAMFCMWVSMLDFHLDFHFEVYNPQRGICSSKMPCRRSRSPSWYLTFAAEAPVEGCSATRCTLLPLFGIPKMLYAFHASDASTVAGIACTLKRRSRWAGTGHPGLGCEYASYLWAEKAEGPI